jgi:tRNA dimethylallyltransferase
MFNAGLVNEVEGLVSFKNKNALQTVGYKEVFGYLDNDYGYDEMVELVKRNTRRYAKRQMTWFKNKDKFEWFDAQAFAQINAFIADGIRQKN